MTFGGGLDAQLASVHTDVNDEMQQPAESVFISMEELGIQIPEDAYQTYDASTALEAVPEVRKEALPYLASLNKTGELSYDVVQAIKQKAPSRIVQHRIRQVIRAIDHYDLSSDANAALRVTAVFRHLPENLGEYDQDVAAIGRKFGMIEPENEPAAVEADELNHY